MSRRLVLASASARRSDILTTLGIRFEICPSDVEEVVRAGETPRELTRRLARAKALDVWRRTRGYVLGADTVVVVDSDVLGKPIDVGDAIEMLGRLSGGWHEVVTGVALAHEGGVDDLAVVTRVRFRPLADDRIRRYAETGEGLDKAGAYAVQGIGSGLVEEIAGSYTNVVGLPAAQTVELLESCGVLEEWP